MNIRLASIRNAFVAFTAIVSFGTRAFAQDADLCGVYATALKKLVPDSTVPIVAYDSVSLATPGFAFHAYTGMGPPKAGSKVPFTDSLWQLIRGQHRERDALPPCFGAGHRVVRVRYDSIASQFRNRDSGWVNFQKAFPGAQGFYVVGRPYFMNADRSEAMVYIAHASHWLAGSGVVYYLRKSQGVWELVGEHPLWMS